MVATVASSYTDEARGPLGGIADQSASKELGKLWTNWENRTQVSKPGYSFVTQDMLTASLRDMQQRIDNINAPSQAATVQVPSGGSGVSSAGSDLLKANNIWTGTNQWTGSEVVGLSRYSFLGLTSGVVTNPIFTINMVPGVAPNFNYYALIDVEKSSDAGTFGGVIGGNAAIFVQHRIQGTAANVHLAWGIRSHAESLVTGALGAANHVAAGYFIAHAGGSGQLCHGVRVEAWLNGTMLGGYNHAFGVEAAVLRAAGPGSGYTAAFVATAGNFNIFNQNHDYAFLARSLGSRFGSVFTAGAPVTGLGTVLCDNGLDLTNASCDKAAIRIPPGKTFFMDGAGGAVGLWYNPGGAIQLFFTGQPQADPHFSFHVDGTFYAHHAAVIPVNGPLIGFWRLVVGGNLCCVPIYQVP